MRQTSSTSSDVDDGSTGSKGDESDDSLSGGVPSEKREMAAREKTLMTAASSRTTRKYDDNSTAPSSEENAPIGSHDVRCTDLHEMCGSWALSGLCRGLSAYRGYVRKSCCASGSTT